MAKMIPTLYWRRSVSILMCTSGNLLWPSWVGYLIAETLGGEKSVGEEALGVVICHPPPPSLAIIAIIMQNVFSTDLILGLADPLHHLQANLHRSPSSQHGEPSFRLFIKHIHRGFKCFKAKLFGNLR